MSKGWGARTSFVEKVMLNIYDLSELNEHVHALGVGVYHSGIVVGGREYTFGGGAGIFDHEPKGAPNCKFRESIELGDFEGSERDLARALDELKGEFLPNSYNMLTKNCNHFANAFSQSLLSKPIPGYVNRLAYLGSFVSCLIPPELLGQAPTDSEPSSVDNSGFQVFGGRRQEISKQHGTIQIPQGKGYVASSAEEQKNPPDRESMIRNRLARFENTKTNEDFPTKKSES